MRLGFRQSDPRFPFVWASRGQPAARWHAAGEGPANYFADTPVGAWAEFIRHEELDSQTDLAGLERSIWAVELPEAGYAEPEGLDEATLLGGFESYAACQAAARRLRSTGGTALVAPSAALLPGADGGWTAGVDGTVGRAAPRDGRVRVLFGQRAFVGWVVSERSEAPREVLGLVRPLGD